MVYRTDYHIHTTFSDGKAAPEEYIAPALSAGISELGILGTPFFIQEEPGMVHESRKC